MSELHASDGDGRRLLRWGGLAGMLGGILFIFVFFWVGLVVGPDPAEPAGAIARFPDIRAARTVENGLYLAVLLLWIPHFLALNRALRGTSLAPATIGSGLGIVGLTVMAAGALPHAASGPIANLYHAPGAAAADQAMLVVAWQATQGLINGLLVTGLAIVPFGLIGLGVAMLRARAFGRTLGWVSIGLGLAAAGSGIALLVDPLSFVAVVGIFALIVFHVVVGWRMIGLSRSPARSASALAAASARP